MGSLAQVEADGKPRVDELAILATDRRSQYRACMRFSLESWLIVLLVLVSGLLFAIFPKTFLGPLQEHKALIVALCTLGSLLAAATALLVLFMLKGFGIC